MNPWKPRPLVSGLRSHWLRSIGLVAAALLLLNAPRLSAQAAPLRTQGPRPQIHAHATPSQAPVVVDGRTLFYVQERELSFSPADRAAAIHSRIEHLYRDAAIALDSIVVEESDESTDIVAGDLIVMSVTNLDAAAAGRTRQELAADYAARIRSTVTELRKRFGWRSILLASLYTLIATVVLIVVLRLLGRFYPRIYGKFREWQEDRLRAIRIQNFELLTAAQIATFFLESARLLRAVIVIVLFYLYLSLVFSFFPWTHGYAAVLLGYVLTALRFVAHEVMGYLPNLFFAIVIMGCAFYISRFVKLIFREIGQKNIVIAGFYPEWAEPTYKIVRFLIIALTLVVVFPYLPGSSSPAFRGVSLFLGVLFSLGSTSAVANVVAGVILTFMNAFSVGDRVKIADTVGDIIEKNLLVTRIRTIKNVEITIANSMVLASHIFNYSKSVGQRALILHTSVTIGYDAPWRQVHKLLIAAALDTKNILPDPSPFVLQTALNDFYVSYELNAHTYHPAAMAATYSELHQNIQDKFNEAGVEIMSPHYSQLRDGNAVAIPSEYVSDTTPPTVFRVASVKVPPRPEPEGGTTE
jgi:small-conductance mechanosensitive channel